MFFAFRYYGPHDNLLITSVDKRFQEPKGYDYPFMNKLKLNHVQCYTTRGRDYWDFGDGTHSDLEKGTNGYQKSFVVALIYEKTGLYIASLYVMDNDLKICEEPFEITVQI